DRKQGRLPFAEILLEFWIELYIGCVVQKQIELNLFVSRTFQQRRIQRVRLRRNTFRIPYAVRVLPACSLRCQNVPPEHFSVLCRRGGPIPPDRTPGISEAF